MLARRGFLVIAGIVGAGGSLLSQPAEAGESRTTSPGPNSPAALLAFKRRVEAAMAERTAFRPSFSNGDPERYAASGAIVTYAKGFARTPNGRVAPEFYTSYSRAIAKRDPMVFESAPVSRTVDYAAIGSDDSYWIGLT